MPKNKNSAELAAELRSSFVQYLNDPMPKDDLERSLRAHTERIRDIQKSNPRAFQPIQDRNTDAKLEYLNALAFERDNYSDPISQKGMEDAAFQMEFPLGFKEEGGGYSLPGTSPNSWTYGITDKTPGSPQKGMMYFNTANTHEGLTPPMGLGGIIRHESHHRGSPDAREGDVRALDTSYTRALGKEPNVPMPMTGKRMGRLLRDARAKAKKYGLGSKVIPKGQTEEYMHYEDLAALAPEDRIDVLRSAGEYDFPVGGGTIRDLPDKGWWDEGVAGLERLLGLNTKKK